MFTGLIEDVGTVANLHWGAREVRLTITSVRICADLAIGDSVSVNGACLTTVGISGNRFTLLATAETLRRTALGALTVGSLVNLERALRLNDRLGGHLVLGHVDGVGRIERTTAEGEALRVEISVPENLMPYLVAKGSVAVDGVSLTIAGLLPHGFWVALIPHTLGVTTLQHRRAGDMVNLETDIIGKYVARFMGFQSQNAKVPLPTDQGRGDLQRRVSLDLLRDNGFA